MIEYLRWIYQWFRGEVFDIPGRLIALIFVICILLVPLITANQYVLRIFILAAIFAIFAASWDLLAGFTGQINLGHALFFGVAAYTSGMFNLHFHLPPLITIPIGSIMAVIVGLLAGIPALRLRGFYLALVTLSFPVILTGVVFAFSDFTGGELGIYGLSRLSGSRIGDYYITNLVMLVSLYIMYKFTDAGSKIIRTGVILHAIREDEITARASGINTTRYKLFAFAMSGFFAGIAGGLYSHFVRIVGPSTLELLFSFKAILWSIFGGISTIYGAVAGVYILYPTIEFLGIYEVGDKIRFLIFALILIFTLLFMPEGITVWVRDKIEITCQRCKVINFALRRHCRACRAPLHLEKEKL